MRLIEIHEARKSPTVEDEDALLADARRLSMRDFLRQHAPKPLRDPRGHYQAYDADGQAFAAFGPDRVESYKQRGFTVRELVPSRQKLAAYQRYLNQVQALKDRYLAWAEAGKLSEYYGFDPADVTIYHHRDSDTWTAQWKSKRVGVLYLAMRGKDDPPGQRYVHNVAVDGMLRRYGIATKLYDAAEAYLAKQGQHLVPSKTQHPDGTAFWKAGSKPRSSR